MQSHCLYGALFGDIAGSTYEFHPVQSKEFALWPAGSKFTDDTVLTFRKTPRQKLRPAWAEWAAWAG